MTITDNGRLSPEEMDRARELFAQGVTSKNGLQKGLRVGWPKAEEALSRLTAEATEREQQRAENRRARLARLRPRKARASRLPVRLAPLPPAPTSAVAVPVTETASVEVFAGPAAPLPEAPAAAGAVAAPRPLPPAVETVLEEAPPAAAEVSQTSSGDSASVKPGVVVTFVLSVLAATAGGVYATTASMPSGRALAAAVLFCAVVAGGLAWSTATLVRALVAGRTARDVALDLASWAVAGVAGFLAAYGQVKFAQWAGVTGNMRFLVPGILEPSVVVLLLLANRRVKRRRAGFPAKPIGKLLALAAVLGGFAVYTNVVHAGGKAGLVFGAATVVGLILWWVKLQDDAAPDDWDDAPQSKRLSRKTSRYRLLRWLILFPQTRRAWLISLDHSISDAEVGLDMARRWRRSFDDGRDSNMSRRKARRHASAQVDKYLLEENGATHS